ncbi:hypothetical protein ABG768_019936, partial [Culter alburnus]
FTICSCARTKTLHILLATRKLQRKQRLDLYGLPPPTSVSARISSSSGGSRGRRFLVRHSFQPVYRGRS